MQKAGIPTDAAKQEEPGASGTLLPETSDTSVASPQPPAKNAAPDEDALFAGCGGYF